MNKKILAGCLIWLFFVAFCTVVRPAKAGLLSHIVVYEIGKHNGQGEADQKVAEAERQRDIWKEKYGRVCKAIVDKYGSKGLQSILKSAHVE